MMQENDRFFLENKLTFWNHLTTHQRSCVLSASTLLHYTQGASIHDATQDCMGLLLIKSGILRIYILSEEGREITLYRLEAGDVCILSASCILQNITFDVHIEAVSDCDIIKLGLPVLSDLIKQNIYVENFSLRLTSERFSDVMWAMQQILFMSFDKRLAIFLLDEITKSKQDTLYMTHEQIARLMGSAREVVSRMLKYFSKEGIVSISRGEISVIDKERLRKLAIGS